MLSGIFEIQDPNGGVVFEYTNTTGRAMQDVYSCVTAPIVVRCDVELNDEIVDTVWAGAGGSHSWWLMAGGGMLRKTLNPGDTVRVKLDGPGALRIDWENE